MKKRCAFLTMEDRAGFFINDHLLFEPMQRAGWAVQEIPWDQDGVEWARFDAVVIRSTWDYQNKPEAFLNTLQTIENETQLFNPTAICKWNLTKTYLRDLQSCGVKIVPTNWLAVLTENELETAREWFQSSRLIAKPQIGANADDTYVIDLDNPGSFERPLRTFCDKPLLLQPFVDSIQSEGEYSLFFFGGEFSHAIIKTPATGDFRVQEEHGGQIKSIFPADNLLQLGEKALRTIGQTLLYARVDIVVLSDESPAVIELELIEPSLYFDQCDNAAEMFANELVRMYCENIDR